MIEIFIGIPTGIIFLIVGYHIAKNFSGRSHFIGLLLTTLSAILLIEIAIRLLQLITISTGSM
jgi:hypothetical protein